MRKILFLITLFTVMMTAYASTAMASTEYLKQNPMFYWSFDEEGEIAESDGANSADINVPSAVEHKDGLLGKCLSFDAKEYAFANGVVPELKGAAAVTICGAFKNYDFPDSTAKQYMLLKMFIDGNLGGINIYIEGQELAFEARSTKTDAIKRIKIPLTEKNKWHSFIAVADFKNKKMLLYIDGELKGTSEALFATNSLEIESPQKPDLTLGGAGTLRFRGALDEICILNYGLGEKDVASISEMMSVKDEKQNQYVKIKTGFETDEFMCSEESVNILEYEDENGKFGKCISFSGAQKPLSIEKNWQKVFNGSEYISIAFWVKSDAACEKKTGLFSMYNGSRKALDISVCKDEMNIMVKSAIGDDDNILKCGFQADGLWHHIAVAVDFKEKTATAFWDTEEVATKKMYFMGDKYKISFVNYSAMLGGENNGRVFNGCLDELVVLTKPFESEIQELTKKGVDDINFSNYIYAEADFEDIKNSDFLNSISYVVSRGIMTKVHDNCFLPDANVRRIEFISMINKVLGLKNVKYKNSAEDMLAEDKNADEFQTALDNGIIPSSFIRDNKFKPNAAITKVQVSEVFNSIGAKKGYAEDNVFYNEMQSFLSDGDELITREEIAYVLQKFIKFCEQ